MAGIINPVNPTEEVKKILEWDDFKATISEWRSFGGKESIDVTASILCKGLKSVGEAEAFVETFKYAFSPVEIEVVATEETPADIMLRNFKTMGVTSKLSAKILPFPPKAASEPPPTEPDTEKKPVKGKKPIVILKKGPVVEIPADAIAALGGNPGTDYKAISAAIPPGRKVKNKKVQPEPVEVAQMDDTEHMEAFIQDAVQRIEEDKEKKKADAVAALQDPSIIADKDKRVDSPLLLLQKLYEELFDQAAAKDGADLALPVVGRNIGLLYQKYEDHGFKRLATTEIIRAVTTFDDPGKITAPAYKALRGLVRTKKQRGLIEKFLKSLNEKMSAADAA